MSVLPTAPVPSSATDSRSTSLLVGGALALVAAAFWSTWWSFPGTWSENRTHGYVIAALCGWMIWRDREKLAAGSAPFAPANALLVGLSLVWLAATVISARVVHQTVVPLMLLTWLLAVRGAEAARVAAPIAGAFVIALPVWEVLTWPLQRMTAVVTGVALRAVGIEATIKEELITIPAGSLIVANTCSGLGYFMTALTISTVYAFVYVPTWPVRRRIIGVAAGLALLANWVRVFGLAVIANNTAMQSPLMKDHEAYGWWIFAAVMALFFFFLPRIEGRAVPAAATPAPPIPERTPGVVAKGAVALASVAALVGPLLFVLVSLVPASGEPEARLAGIVPGGQWAPTVGAPSAWGPAFVGATEQRTEFLTRDSSTVRVDRFIYRHQAEGAEMIGSENAVAPDSLLLEERVVGPLDANARSVRQAAVREGKQVRMVWYWYKVAGVDTPSRAKAKLLELLAFFGRHAVSEVVTLSVPCEGGNCAGAVRTLFNLATGREMPAAPGQ